MLATTCVGEESHVVLLRGRNGSELWRRTFRTGRYCSLSLHVAAFRSRDVVVAATIDSTVNVLRLNGRNGATRWHRLASGGAGEAFVAQLSAEKGDIVLHANGVVLRLSPATGLETFQVPGSGDPHDRIAVSRRGTVLFARRATRASIADGFEVHGFSRKLVRHGKP